MDCLGTYFSHAQTCENVCVESATQCTASVHTLHMPKPVIPFVFKVLRNALLGCILYTTWMAARKWDPAAIVCFLSPIGDTTHLSKKTGLFFFIGTLPCCMCIAFCNRSSCGGNYVGVVTQARAYTYIVRIRVH